MAVHVRVKVQSGDGSEDLGEGTLVGFVPVYIFRHGAGSLLSFSMAEEKPPHALEGELEKIEGNPKIVLDSGRTVYGCQVWWEPIEEGG